MAATAMIHARVEESVKKQAAIALERMGLTVSSAVNMFLTRVAVDQAIPFEVRVSQRCDPRGHGGSPRDYRERRRPIP